MLCSNFHNINILIQFYNMSAVAATNKMDSTRLIDMDQVVHLIKNFILRHLTVSQQLTFQVYLIMKLIWSQGSMKLEQ